MSVVVTENEPSAYQQLAQRVPEIMEVLHNDQALSQMLLDMINSM